MGEERGRSVFVMFLRQHIRAGLLFFMYTVIFWGIFSLYDLEAEAVLYAAALCGLFTCVVLSVRYVCFRKKHKRYRRILHNIPLLEEELPSADTLAESDCQDIILALKGSLDAALNSWQNERSETMDYYTTWVHQIKTPISVMRMLLQEEDTGEHRELLAELFRIEQYVEMVLGYLRLGGGSRDFVFQEYDLDPIVRQAIHKYAPLFVRNRIRLSYEPTDVRVLTDEKWLLFLIEQVLSNAIKYTPEGKVDITVTRDKVLRIADTGIGIAPEDLPRIFEKGFTGYNGRADKKSTGLGLYLCRLTAEKLSHKIKAESVVGEGTVFSVDLYRERLETE